eukprot:CAMPEP_0113640358 /NCGR_PEP_ID=MMETSP0017_2-20120614/21181_1 /TAXON_ID=2856 /ORGANISM="Cylindrotheca closterium" /LENGTH=731 /DNA_ID=CAMNT_0000551635 /DNA_START=335 /DNA_END=2530 /DNA_ORIENTATION=- /assembly_acc=CAM_ASM_000147
MAIDEFGREVPGSRGHHRRSPSPPRHRGDGTPSHLNEALPTSRYGRERDERPPGPGRKRKHRSESPLPRRKQSKAHPSTRYAEEPMLCQYLWKEANPDKGEKEYDDYRRGYCLNYVRTFFNEHMDDSWFRSLYSPLGTYRVALQAQDRMSQEAETFARELRESVGKNKAESDSCLFVLNARLGGGVKQASSYSSSPSKKNANGGNIVPSTHVFNTSAQVMQIQEVPPHVTDEQLTAALMSHCTIDAKSSQIVLHSSTPAQDLSRSCYLQAPGDVRKDIIQNLNHLGRTESNQNGAANKAHVPRKEDTYIPKTLELKVECSDAYGRLEMDADGKGTAPEEGGGVPARTAVVWVSTQPITPTVKVLSVAVSSKERIQQDKEAAIKLANAFDHKRDVPQDCRLEALLRMALPRLQGSDATLQDTEDALDVSIAYLRRVHLFSFYNGCVAASNISDVFNGNNAASTIHLRLANADDILQQTQNSANTTEQAGSPKVDLLVQRLNDAIENSLEESKSWDSAGPKYLVSSKIDSQAKDIEQDEARGEENWIKNHSLIDNDGRARCSFHFCRKLFKDITFLKKHLLKKHPEFLKAERAKCHDTYMMESWDKQEQRPVPPILVDCGRAFSTVPSPVLGAAEPMAADPEPELWKRQEERRKQDEEEKARRERNYDNHNQSNNDGGPPAALNQPLSEPRGPRQNGFVDVDDMQEEKVEMAFDDIEVQVQPPKKKKKKKKLL